MIARVMAMTVINSAASVLLLPAVVARVERSALLKREQVQSGILLLLSISANSSFLASASASALT